MTGPTGRALSRTLGRNFIESWDGSVCNLEHDAGSFWVLDLKAGCETCLKVKQLPMCIFTTDLFLLLLIRGWRSRKATYYDKKLKIPNINSYIMCGTLERGTMWDSLLKIPRISRWWPQSIEQAWALSDCTGVTLMKTVLIPNVKTVVPKARIYGIFWILRPNSWWDISNLYGRDGGTHSFRWVQKYLTDLPEMGLLKAIEFCFVF